MPLETGTTIADLVSTNPAATDGLGQADDHIRLIKAVLKATFPNFTGVLDATDAALDTASTAIAGMPWDTADISDDAITYAKMQNVSATNKLLGRASSGAGNIEEIDCTAAGRALLDDADASAQRTTLGLATVANTGAYSDLSGKPTLGTAAALDVGTTASKVVQLDGSAKLPAVDGSALTNISYANLTNRDFVKLSTVTLGGAQASIEFGGTSGNGTIDSTYRAYVFECVDIVAVSASQFFRMLLSDDNGSTYESSGYAGGVVSASPGFAVGNMTSVSTYIQLTSTHTTTAGRGSCGTVMLFNPSGSSSHKRTKSEFVVDGGGTAHGAGTLTANAAINGVKFEMTSGNLASGCSITMYGIR